jgi:PAS domain S-box-containing protein
MEELKGNYSLEEELLLAKAKIRELEDFNQRVMLFDDTLYQIKEEIRNKHGEEFFDSAVLSIQKAIRADYVLIGILDDNDSDNILTLSICWNGEIINNIIYPLMDSPFETVYGKDMSLYPEDLQELFPNDSILKELNLNAFIGLSLFNSESAPIGIVAALYNNTLDDPDFYQSIMNFFEEVIKVQQEQITPNNEISDLQFREFLSNLQQIAIILDKDGNLSFCNDYFIHLTGYSRDEIIGHNWLETFIPESDKTEINVFFNSAINNTEFKIYHENLIKLKTGEDRLIKWTNTPIFDATNNIYAIVSIGEDITNKWMNDHIIKDSEERYKALANATSEGIIISDNGYCIDVNQKFCDMLGYDYEELIGQYEVDFIADESKELARINLYSNYEEPYEIVGLRKDGSKFPAVLHGKMFDYQGKQVRITTVRDISERKHVISKLEESEEKYRYLIELLPDGVIVHQNGIIVFGNEAAVKILKYDDVSEVLGKNAIDFVHPDYRELALNRIKLAYKDGMPVPTAREIFLCKDGSPVELEVNAQPILYDNKLAMQVVFRDMSERKKADLALKESEERFRIIMSNMQDVVFTLDCEQRHTGVFGPWATKNGSSPEMFIGKTGDEILGEDANRIHREANERALKGEYVIYEWNLPTPDSILYFQTSIAPIFDDKGNIQGLVGVGRDITAIKQAEVSIRESEEKYRALVTNALEGIMILDMEGTIIFANNSIAITLEIDDVELVIGKKVFDFIAEESLPNVAEDFVNIINGVDSYISEYRCFTAKGNELWLESIGKIIQYEGKTADLVSLRNITDRKNAEIAMFESESKFRILFETMSQGVVYHADDGSIISANPAAERILGLTFEQLIGSSSFDPRWKLIKEDGSTITPEEQASSIALRTGKPVQNMIKGVYRPETDDYVWISVDAVPQFKNGDDKPYQVYAIFNDITERRATLLAMEESEKKYRHIFTTLTDALFVIDYDGIIIDVNPAAINLYGYSYEELIGLHTSQLITIEYHPVFNDFVQSIIKKGTFHGGTIDKRKDGSTFFTDVIGTKIQYKGKHRFLAIVRDVTDTKNAQRILDESEKRFRSLFENMDDGFVLHEMIFDNNRTPIDYKFLEINDAYEKLTGLNRVDVIGKTVCKVLPGIENDHADWIGQYGKVVLTGESLTFENYSEVIGKWYHVTGYKATGNQFAVLVQDITESKLLENRIQKINEELELKVSERTAQLENTMNELTKENEIRKQIQDDLIRYQQELQLALEKEKELNQLKSAFMSMVSHQYRTPLTVIQTSTELLAKYFIHGNKEKHDKHIKNISESIDRMVEMLEKIMAIGKSDINEQNIIPEKFNIVHLINTSIEIVKGYDRYQHNIAFDFSDDSIEIFSKKFYIEQILNNLLSNAIKYSNSVTTITVSCIDRNDFVKLIISDEGIGIPEQDLKHIFEHFFRASNVETIYGTGLGLSIVKRFSDSIKAEIFIESVQNKGTKITLLIPKNIN